MTLREMGSRSPGTAQGAGSRSPGAAARQRDEVRIADGGRIQNANGGVYNAGEISGSGCTAKCSHRMVSAETAFRVTR